ncbi:MAG: LPXTG cell wall anchor domain-containing protein [Lachnospiraceae bacterium]|nr:LPXTG cell wall anchor domain-containing protein [Lachnospiraceae bacterium]
MLETGDYYLFETTAPTDYVLPETNYWTVSVNTAEQRVTFNGGNTMLFYDGGESGYYILNYKEYELPLTGGMGTRLYTIVGLALMTGTVAAHLCYKRRRYE